MKRIAWLVLFCCLGGCRKPAEPPTPTAFEPNDLAQSFRWMHAVYDPVREAEQLGNDLLVAEAGEKAAKQLKTAVGQTVRWSFTVEAVRRTDPEAPGKPGGFILSFEPPDFQKNEEGEDTLFVYFSQTKTAQEDDAYVISLDESDRAYARTLTKGMTVEITGTLAGAQALDATAAGFTLKITQARIVK